MKKVTAAIIILYLVLASTTILIYSVKGVKAMEPEEIGVRCATGQAVPKQYERFCRGEVQKLRRAWIVCSLVGKQCRHSVSRLQRNR